MLAGLFKFILGFLLAIAILIGGGVATALYLMNRISAPPPKPIYANDKPEVKAQVPNLKNQQQTKATPTPASQAAIENSPSTTSTPNPTENSQTQEESSQPLPSGAYRARVNWQQGLSLRKDPTPDSERIGGVTFNQKVIVLEESSDKAWQKIRLEDGEQEGWVKAGNIEKTEENE